MNRAEQIRAKRDGETKYVGFPNGSLEAQTFRLAQKAKLLAQLPDREREFPLTLRGVRGRKIDRMDMARWVREGVADCGITGWDYVNEFGPLDVEVIRRFPYGRKTVGKPTTLVLADYAKRFKTIDDLRGSGAVIATELPKLTRRRLQELGLADGDVTIDQSHGGTEGVGEFGASELITDVVETGKSLGQSPAYRIADIFESTPVLIANPEALRSRTIRRMIEKFGTLFDAALRAETEPMSLLILNVPSGVLARVQRVLPGSKGENVSPAKEGWVSVNAEVSQEQLPRIVPILLRLGCDDIDDVTTGMRWSQKSVFRIPEPQQ